MNYSDIKSVKKLCENQVSSPDWREVVAALDNSDDDFTVDGVRFINAEAIDLIQCEELESDEYILGCFNAWFLADVLSIDKSVIEAMQKAEAFEAIGKLIISMGKVKELQQEYARADGYGHHFNSYDNSEDEFSVNGQTYYIFDTRG